MKVYSFGFEDRPAVLLLPGTFCHWRSNFGAVIPLLKQNFHGLCVSYDGFDETEDTVFPTMLEETEKLEAYILAHCGGRIRAAYGCSLGGSFVELLAARPYGLRHTGQLRSGSVRSTAERYAPSCIRAFIATKAPRGSWKGSITISTRWPKTRKA